MREFVFYSDAGHAWVEVPMDLVKELGIADKISAYSYRKGDNAYLEEDCDASLFINALQKAGMDFKFQEHYMGQHAVIRNYKQFYV